ncbi:MAG: hypothetical protein L0I76_05325 [Pseudonocardia sp.]|nr:hypothetical protein [Pseudonocardia sp.]
MRTRIAEGLGFLGVELDPDSNGVERGAGDAFVSPDGAAAACPVVSASDDLIIAEQVRAILNA